MIKALQRFVLFCISSGYQDLFFFLVCGIDYQLETDDYLHYVTDAGADGIKTVGNMQRIGDGVGVKAEINPA